MEQLPQRGNTGFTLGGFLILAALGTFLWKGAPLDSVRPSSEQSGWYEHKLYHQVPARLWQDPFKAVYAHEQAVKEGTAAIISKKDPKTQITEFLSVDSKTVVSLLMVMVTPGSYAELEERRRRRRYAVLSGLSEEDFVPQNPEILNVFYQPTSYSNVKDCPPNVVNGEQTNISIKKCFPVPYELYDYEDPSVGHGKQHKVLVFWLNEAQFVDSPLKRIKDFLEVLLPEPNLRKGTLRATLLGPGRSDALRNLVNKKEDAAFKWIRDKSGLSEFNIFSSTATVADADLSSKGRSNTISEKHTSSPLIQRYREFSGAGCDKTNVATSQRKPCMRFLRTIQNDEVLIKKLATELIINRSIDIEKDYVVVLSEWDTYFGRTLPLAFARYFHQKGWGDDKVVRYSYQRGMDGSIVGEQNSLTQIQLNNQQKTKGRVTSIDETTIRRPVGPGQFDYIRRLATDIQKKDREWRMTSGHGVRAVVLLGSDVYDKLLILRALRPVLPSAIFATTDLDAQFLHPAEFAWTRNMIVASTYDLSLSPQIPMTTMPFRDSYQTAVYLTTRLVFNKNMQETVAYDQENFYKKIPPQLMEIGRQAIVQLPVKEDSTGNWNHVLVGQFIPEVAVGFMVIAILGIFSLHQLRPKAGREIVVLGLMFFVFVALSILIYIFNIEGEPVALLTAASVWPAVYIRVFGVMLSLVFIWSVIHILHKSWSNLGSRYFWSGPEIYEDGVTVNEIWIALKRKAIHPVQSLKRIKSTQILAGLMFLVLIVILAKVLPIKMALGEKILLLSIIWCVLIVFWWLLIYGRIKKDFKVLSVNKWASKCVPTNRDAVEMWRLYGQYGAGDQRFLRTIAYILIYMAFASIIFAILGSPGSPCRGDFTCKIDRVVLGFSVLSMLVLLFLVVDAARLCICWVDSMHKHEVDWSNTRKSDYVQRLRLPDSHAVAWIQVHLIGERTSDVTRLIYFPVLIILLLLLARSTYFDNWDFPQALAIVIGLNFIIALGSVVRLNCVAKTARDKILRKLQDEKLAADREKKLAYEPNPVERRELIVQLESLRIGAYLRVWEQPPVRATLMLLGGVVLTYAEYLAVFL